MPEFNQTYRLYSAKASEAAEAGSKGECLGFDSAGDVKLVDAASQLDNQLDWVFGIAAEDFASGEVVEFVDQGYAWVLAGTGGLTEGESVVAEASNGHVLGLESGGVSVYPYLGSCVLGVVLKGASTAGDWALVDIKPYMLGADQILFQEGGIAGILQGQAVQIVSGEVTAATVSSQNAMVALEAGGDGDTIRVAFGSGVVPYLGGAGNVAAGDIAIASSADAIGHGVITIGVAGLASNHFVLGDALTAATSGNLGVLRLNVHSING